MQRVVSCAQVVVDFGRCVCPQQMCAIQLSCQDTTPFRREHCFPNISTLPITSARGTVIAAEVAVKNMYHEEPELLPAASGTNTEKGAPPTVGGDEEPVWPWEQPVWPAEVAEVVAAANLAMGGAISADSGDQTGQDSNISLLWITEIHLRD